MLNNDIFFVYIFIRKTNEIYWYMCKSLKWIQTYEQNSHYSNMSELPQACGSPGKMGQSSLIHCCCADPDEPAQWLLTMQGIAVVLVEVFLWRCTCMRTWSPAFFSQDLGMQDMHNNTILLLHFKYHLHVCLHEMQGHVRH